MSLFDFTSSFRAVGLVYEIKSIDDEEAGQIQLEEYLGILNTFDTRHRTWIEGDSTTYQPIDEVSVMGQQYRINPPVNGVITYEEIDSNGNPQNPLLDPQVIAVVTGASLAALATLSLDLGTGALEAAY